MGIDPTFWNGKRVFLTGHTGFKGSWLTLWLQSLGAQVAGVALAHLHDAGFQVPLVLTQPDRPAGRGMQLQPSAVKQYALSKGIEVLQPLSLRMDSKEYNIDGHELRISVLETTAPSVRRKRTRAIRTVLPGPEVKAGGSTATPSCIARPRIRATSPRRRRSPPSS